MADEQSPKAAIRRIVQRQIRIAAPEVKEQYCNYLTTQASAERVVLNFGFDPRRGPAPNDAQQAKLLHKVVLSPAMARRVKDTLVTLFQKRDAPRVRVTAKVVPAKTPNRSARNG